MLVTLYKIGEGHFRLLGANGSHVKAKNERFIVAGLRCRQNPDFKFHVVVWQTTGKKKKKSPKKKPHTQHDYFSSFNQSNH